MAIKLDPKNISYYINKITCLMALEKYEDAIKW
jgi:hypothetical protein